MRRPFFSLLLIVVLACLLVACKDGKQEAGTAPDFTLQDSNGRNVTLSDYRGKVVFLNFWATWCPPCREEMPSMERLNEVFLGRDFVILAVNVESEGLASVGPFLQQHTHRFPVLLDVEGKAQKLYGVDRFPETFVIDKQGKVVEHLIGARDWSSPQMLGWFDSLVGKP